RAGQRHPAGRRHERGDDQPHDRQPHLPGQPERDGPGARRVPQGPRDRAPLMAIAPIGAVSGLANLTATQATTSTTATTATSGQSFASVLDSVNRAGMQADQMATQIATGQLSDVATFMSASTKAELAVSMAVAVRNRAVDAYQEIMRMQV